MIIFSLTCNHTVTVTKVGEMIGLAWVYTGMAVRNHAVTIQQYFMLILVPDAPFRHLVPYVILTLSECPGGLNSNYHIVNGTDVEYGMEMH